MVGAVSAPDPFPETQPDPNNMAEAGQLFLLQPPAEGAMKLAGRRGGLQIRKQNKGKLAKFTAWDCFDGSVRSSGRLLVERGSKLHLLGPGYELTQSAKRTGNFLHDLRAGPVKDALSGLFPLRCLLPAASGRLARRRYRFTWKQAGRGAMVRWHFSGAFGSISLVEVLAEPGEPRDAAVQLLAALGAEPAVPGDLYALLAPGRPVYMLKPPVPLAPEQPALEAAAAIIRSCLGVARQNEPGIAADHDTEFLHDYRISLRRIRSVLSLFKGVFTTRDAARLKQAFSGLMDATGRLRDLDVYLLQREGFYARVPEQLHPGLDAMFRAFEAERQQCHQKLAQYLAGARYKRQITALQAEFAETAVIAPGPKAGRPALQLAQKLIWKRYSKVCRIAAGITADTPDSEVHELRINCKKLRYLMELFEPLFESAELKAVLKPLKRLQNTLGDFNDCSVQQAALLEFASSPAATREIALSAGALIAVLHQNQRDARAMVGEKFQAFDSPETQSRFRAMFSG
ncbi:CHAD domain-containing protein [Leisingera caerulea]|uniref:CYTH and CHAD domain-containing protein n=1 Tax=Leisingera caerulea TaxID=506591 RepID=UPI0021A58659|nr:CHAD domain-containing protein [Leisingera caerulea]UWQ61664.1 CHAD domain-containing protein [Leisingera caerulea]